MKKKKKYLSKFLLDIEFNWKYLFCFSVILSASIVVAYESDFNVFMVTLTILFMVLTRSFKWIIAAFAFAILLIFIIGCFPEDVASGSYSGDFKVTRSLSSGSVVKMFGTNVVLHNTNFLRGDIIHFEGNVTDIQGDASDYYHSKGIYSWVNETKCDIS